MKRYATLPDPRKTFKTPYSPREVSYTILATGYKATPLVIEYLQEDAPKKRKSADASEAMSESSSHNPSNMSHEQTESATPLPPASKTICSSLRIKQATAKGYVEVPQGYCFDISYPDSLTRRGRMQGGVESRQPLRQKDARTSVYMKDIPTPPKIVGYTRDAKGKVVGYHLKDIANTIHCSSGHFCNTGQYIIEPITAFELWKTKNLKSTESENSHRKKSSD